MSLQKGLFSTVRFDVEAGRRERDRGTARVLRREPAEWRREYRRIANLYLSRIDPGEVFTSEHVRKYVSDYGLENPHHVNVWGAMFRSVLSAWLTDDLVEVGDLVAMQRPEAHRRRNPSYRKRGQYGS